MPHITIDGVSLEYLRYGAEDRNRTSLVFLHHGLGSAGLWRDFPEALAARTGLPAIAYSRRGYGGSDPGDGPRPIEYLENEALDVLPKVLDGLAIDKAICVGHSEGGSIALVFAAEHPSRVDALLLESAHVLVEQSNLASIARTRKDYETGGLRERLKRHHGDNVDGAFYGWSGMWLQPGFDRWTIEGFASRVKCPVLAILGCRDEYVSEEHFERLVGLLGGPVEAVKMACGHAPHEECRDAVLDRMVRFVDAL